MSTAQSSTDARRSAADMLRTALPDIAVFDVWPGTASPPCLIVGLGQHSQASRCLWEVDLIVTCVAPGGDNDGAITALEDLADRVTVALRDTYGTVDRDPPVQNQIGGATHLVAAVHSSLTVTL